jgi:hypothetical protein
MMKATNFLLMALPKYLSKFLFAHYISIRIKLGTVQIRPLYPIYHSHVVKPLLQNLLQNTIKDA